MVRPNDPQHVGRFLRQGRQHPFAEGRVLGDLAELFRREQSGLVQDRLARPDLPDVVQLSAEPNAVQALSDEAQLFRGPHGIPADPDRVAEVWPIWTPPAVMFVLVWAQAPPPWK